MTAPARPTMTPERWRAVDQVLQRALVCTRDDRDDVVAHSCGNDTALRNEVASLLAAYDATPGDFLERPAIEEHRVSSPAAHLPSPPRDDVTTGAHGHRPARGVCGCRGHLVRYGDGMEPRAFGDGRSMARDTAAIRQQTTANTASSTASGATGELSLSS